MIEKVIVGILVPPLCVIPMHIVWMYFLHRKEPNKAGFGVEAGKALRFACTFFYPLALIVHTIVGGLAFLCLRWLHLQGVWWWSLVYLTPLALAALKLSDTWLDLQGAGMRLGFAFVVALAAYPFIQAVLTMS